MATDEAKLNIREQIIRTDHAIAETAKFVAEREAVDRLTILATEISAIETRFRRIEAKLAAVATKAWVLAQTPVLLAAASPRYCDRSTTSNATTLHHITCAIGCGEGTVSVSPRHCRKVSLQH
jgi:hypothetical protein